MILWTFLDPIKRLPVTANNIIIIITIILFKTIKYLYNNTVRYRHNNFYIVVVRVCRLPILISVHRTKVFFFSASRTDDVTFCDLQFWTDTTESGEVNDGVYTERGGSSISIIHHQQHQHQLSLRNVMLSGRPCPLFSPDAPDLSRRVLRKFRNQIIPQTCWIDRTDTAVSTYTRDNAITSITSCYDIMNHVFYASSFWSSLLLITPLGWFAVCVFSRPFSRPKTV